MDSKTLVWSTIRDFRITNYTALWFKYIKPLPNITAVELDCILIQLNKEKKIDLFPPDSEDARFLVEKKKMKYVGQWAIIG